MRRREFMSLFGAVATAWPLAARAQQGERMRCIGVLTSGWVGDPDIQAGYAAFQQGLEQLAMRTDNGGVACAKT